MSGSSSGSEAEAVSITSPSISTSHGAQDSVTVGGLVFRLRRSTATSAASEAAVTTSTATSATSATSATAAATAVVGRYGQREPRIGGQPRFHPDPDLDGLVTLGLRVVDHLQRRRDRRVAWIQADVRGNVPGGTRRTLPATT